VLFSLLRFFIKGFSMETIFKRLTFPVIFLVVASTMLFATGSEHGEESSILHAMTIFVFQIGLIIFASKLGGMLFKKLKMPSVIGELGVGILIGPYLLGSLSLPGFAHGLFPLIEGAGVPVSTELYAIATIASIILLFIAGLETDLNLFLRFSVAGLVVGLGGVLFSFVLGDIVGMLLLKQPFTSPVCMFLGVLSTATSVGITARILSEQKKMDSAEGVTILAAAVIDDVVGIILLAIILGIAAFAKSGGEGAMNIGRIGFIAFKAIGVWLLFTILGLVFSRQISRFLKMFKSPASFSILGLGLALIVAGIFEKAGLAMIIGAYVTGLSLSNTDISYVIQEKMHSLYLFFVPIFFTVMGMLVNVKVFFSIEVLVFGLIFTISAFIAKIAGCGLPSLLLNFNVKGAMRVGLGMVPRGEVALIVAGIGISTGLLDEKLFGLAVFMTLATTVITPPLLSKSLKGGRGTRKEVSGSDKVSTEFHFPEPDLMVTVRARMLQFLNDEGFYIHLMELDEMVYQVRKDQVFISIYCDDTTIAVESSPSEVSYIKTLMYEVMINLNLIFSKLKQLMKPEDLRADASEVTIQKKFKLDDALDKNCIIMNIKGTTKDEIITEMLDILDSNGKFLDRALAEHDVFEREKVMTTGLEKGIATPHGKSDGVDTLCVAIGLKKEGVDFAALDGNPSNIFICAVSPRHTTGPHIKLLATMSSILYTDEARREVLAMTSADDLYNWLITKAASKDS
jgi:Kef-type K+ transport system membrane component KefB/mannitol/fructose-specific phosphotransferase system IIA component (Ntr-type)